MTNERVDLLAASMPETRLPVDPAGEELAGALWNFLSGVEAQASVH